MLWMKESGLRTKIKVLGRVTEENSKTMLGKVRAKEIKKWNN